MVGTNSSCLNIPISSSALSLSRSIASTPSLGEIKKAPSRFVRRGSIFQPPHLISQGPWSLLELAPASRSTRDRLLWFLRASPSTTLDKMFVVYYLYTIISVKKFIPCPLRFAFPFPAENSACGPETSPLAGFRAKSSALRISDFGVSFSNPGSAMHHVGCMAAQNPTWFWSQPTIRNWKARPTSRSSFPRPYRTSEPGSPNPDNPGGVVRLRSRPPGPHISIRAGTSGCAPSGTGRRRRAPSIPPWPG
jgi:hypothetical protein